MIARLAVFAAALYLMAPQAPFRAETRLVVLHVGWKEGGGERVGGLEKAAFTVYEDGVRQPIALFRRDDVPVSMGLLIDNSGSMRPRRAQVESDALALAGASNPDDEIFVMNFADRPHLDVPLTRERQVLEARIARVDSIGGTALYDAVEAGTEAVRAGTHDRRVLVVISDGRDNASQESFAGALTRAERADVAV